MIPTRALHIDVSMTLLSDGASLAEKNARLAAWLTQKVASKVVRFYRQPTVPFGE